MTTRYPHLNDPEHWKSRAEEARVQAEEMTTFEAKKIMLGIARDYDVMAQRAQQRLNQ